MAVGFTRFSRLGENLGRIHPLSAEWTEGLDGTDKLVIACYEDLAKAERIVWMDAQGIWHEHIVDDAQRTHDASGKPATVATCLNSLVETWDDYIVDKRPNGTVTQALESILAGTRWAVGACTQEGTSSHTFYHVSVMEGIGQLLKAWGGELETEITCDGSKVTARKVKVLAARGSQHTHKRFTWTKDLVDISRTEGPENPKSRIYAYGKGEATEAGGYGRRIGIESVNGGIPYVEDTTATERWGRPDASGALLPAVGIFVDEQCDDPATLLAEAQAELERQKEPKVTYVANVIDLGSFGRVWERSSLGDRVQIIDKEFDAEGLRLQGRISKIERDLLSGDARITFGTLTNALTTPWALITERLLAISNRSAGWDAAGEANASWLDLLLTSLNAQFDASGTYRFSSFEQGDIWSSVPLDENGRATTAGGWAININGQGMRLASSLNADGSWNWRAFGTGEGFTADEIIAGRIASANGTDYWDLESGEIHLTDYATIAYTDSGITTALGNLYIGGTNLLTDSDAPSLTKVMAGSDRVITGNTIDGTTGTIVKLSADSRPCKAKYAAKIYIPADNEGKYRYIRYYADTTYTADNCVTLVNGNKYTISCWAKCSGGKADLWFQWGHGSYMSSGGTYAQLTTSWQRISWTFTFDSTVTGDLLAQIYFIVSARDANATTVQITGMKLESGTKATDWRPSPEDGELANTLIRQYADGVLVCKSGQTIGALVNAGGSFDIVKVAWSSGVPTASTVYATYGETSTIGASNITRLVISSEGMQLYWASHLLLGFMHTGTTTDFYVSFGNRLGTAGNHSFVEGWCNTASGAASHAEGTSTAASGANSHAEGRSTTASGWAAHAEGQDSVASGEESHAEGYGSTAKGSYSHASGNHTIAAGTAQFVCGAYNVENTSHKFIVGGGASNSRKSILTLDGSGNMVITGKLTQNSDKRLKDHIAYLDDDACEFVRKLRPALFAMKSDGSRHVGFYAQDVEGADEWETDTVTEQYMDESMGPTKTLDYTALIAPLVAYAQHLEKRIEALEAQLGSQ